MPQYSLSAMQDECVGNFMDMYLNWHNDLSDEEELRLLSDLVDLNKICGGAIDAYPIWHPLLRPGLCRSSGMTYEWIMRHEHLIPEQISERYDNVRDLDNFRLAGQLSPKLDHEVYFRDGMINSPYENPEYLIDHPYWSSSRLCIFVFKESLYGRTRGSTSYIITPYESVINKLSDRFEGEYYYEPEFTDHSDISYARIVTSIVGLESLKLEHMEFQESWEDVKSLFIGSPSTLNKSLFVTRDCVRIMRVYHHWIESMIGRRGSPEVGNIPPPLIS